MAEQKSGRKIGLALGGGAILGAAHIGVLKALEENNIKICSLAGTSIGAFIAALYALGWASTFLPGLPFEIRSRMLQY